MPMTPDDTRKVGAPALPLAPEQYSRRYMSEYNGVLRLFFNQLTNVLRVLVDSQGPYGVFASGSAATAFGRMRVAEPRTLFDSKQIHDNQPLFWDDSEVSGSGTSSTFSANLARSRMSVGATTAGKRIRQTFQSFNYQPGKSHLIYLTAVIGTGGTGITQRIGYGDDENGVFFECDDGVMYVNVRSFATGSAVDTRVAQTSWSVDKLDGNGVSGLTVDWDKTLIFVIDFEWLGVGSIRFGIVVNAVVYYVHQVNNSNTLDVVYMSKPNLPLRYELENDGSGVAYNLDHICATVISEGHDVLGVTRSASTSGAPVVTTTEDTVYALVGIGLKSAYIGAVVKLVSAAVQVQTVSEIGEWSLILNPTVASTFTYNDQTNSAVAIAVGVAANTVTGGTVLKSGFLESDSTGGKTIEAMLTEADNARYLGANIAGVMDTIVLCWTPRGGTSIGSVEGSLTWQEL